MYCNQKSSSKDFIGKYDWILSLLNWRKSTYRFQEKFRGKNTNKNKVLIEIERYMNFDSSLVDTLKMSSLGWINVINSSCLPFNSAVITWSLRISTHDNQSCILCQCIVIKSRPQKDFIDKWRWDDRPIELEPEHLLIDC